MKRLSALQYPSWYVMLNPDVDPPAAVCLLHNADINKLEEIAMEKLILIPNKNIPLTIYRQEMQLLIT